MGMFVREIVGCDGWRSAGRASRGTAMVWQVRRIAVSLGYAHSKGVVHRDVKPGNLMIAKGGTPYILDFGISREIQETATRVTSKASSSVHEPMALEMQLRRS